MPDFQTACVDSAPPGDIGDIRELVGYREAAQRFVAIQPGDARPGDVRPGAIQPGDARRGDIQEGDIRPGEVRTDGIREGNIRPGDIRPGDARNYDAGPRPGASPHQDAGPGPEAGKNDVGWPGGANREHRAGRLRQTFRDQLVLDYLHLAESIAGRFAIHGRDRADLTQVAYLGLVKAARGFEESKGDSFAAYAAPTITGELKRYLRDRCWMVRPPRHIQDLRSQLLRAERDLSQQLRREPTEAELAAELDVDVREVREAYLAHTSMRPESLDSAPGHDHGPALAETLPFVGGDGMDLVDVLCLGQAVRELAPSDRALLYGRYYREESQAELGRKFGMSQMQVSRRLSRILVALQRKLVEDPEAQSPAMNKAAQSSFSSRIAASESSTVTASRAGSGVDANVSPRRSSARVRVR